MTKFLFLFSLMSSLSLASPVVYREAPVTQITVGWVLVRAFDNNALLVDTPSGRSRVIIRGIEVGNLRQPKCSKEQIKATISRRCLLDQTEMASKVEFKNPLYAYDMLGPVVIADVFYDDVNLAQIMINNKRALPEGTNYDWCAPDN